MSYDECFTHEGSGFSAATGMFKHIAFRNPKCGDCGMSYLFVPPSFTPIHCLVADAPYPVIQALVKASGRLGLEAFLPPADRDLPIIGGEFASDPYEVPHLPLEERWDDAEFNVFSVMGASRETNVRAWTLRLLQRYRFVVGKPPFPIFVVNIYTPGFVLF